MIKLENNYFIDSDEHCILSEQIPMAWDIKDDEPWRAFK